MNKLKTITVGQLRRELAVFSDDAPLFFGSGDLTFLRTKNRGGESELVQIEFGELYEVTHDPSVPT
jgi:hypothetical protein